MLKSFKAFYSNLVSTDKSMISIVTMIIVKDFRLSIHQNEKICYNSLEKGK